MIGYFNLVHPRRLILRLSIIHYPEIFRQPRSKENEIKIETEIKSKKSSQYFSQIREIIQIET